LLERDDLAVFGLDALFDEVLGEHRAGLLHPAVLLVDPAAFRLDCTSDSRRTASADVISWSRYRLRSSINSESFMAALWWSALSGQVLKSSPSFERRLSRARAIRLLTVPTEIPRMEAISS